MNATIGELVQRIRAMEDELEVQLALARADLHMSIQGSRIEFEHAVARRHREMKTRLLRYVFEARPLIVLTAPVI